MLQIGLLGSFLEITNVIWMRRDGGMDIRKRREDWVDQHGGFWNSTELALIWTQFLAICHTQETRYCVSCWHYQSDVCSSNLPPCSSLSDYMLRNPRNPQNLSQPTHFTLSSSIQVNYQVKRFFQICSFLSVGPRHCVLTHRSLPVWVHHALRKHPSHGICSISLNRKPSGSL